MPSAVVSVPRSHDHHAPASSPTALVDACPVCQTAAPAEEAFVACQVKMETIKIPLLRFRCPSEGCGYLWALPSQRATNHRTLRVARS